MADWLDFLDTSTWPEVVVYSVGPIYASVCTKLDDAETADFVNNLFPLENDLSWAVSDDEHFASGENNPCECHDDKERRHVLFSC